MNSKYQNTIIYIITCNNTSVPDCYVGHTTDFDERKRTHEVSCNNKKSKIKYNYMVYKFIRSHGGWKNWSMYPLYEFSCDNKQAAVLEEQWWYELLGCTLNTEVPGRTFKQWCEDNKERLLEYNKEKITCECGCVSLRCNLPRHKRSQKHKKLMM